MPDYRLCLFPYGSRRLVAHFMRELGRLSRFPGLYGSPSPASGFDKLKAVDSALPAVAHVDGTACVQTVTPKGNSIFHALLMAFHERTGCPALVNTSFNIRGEPIVCSPLEAFECFMKTDIDVLVVGNSYLRKVDQNMALRTRPVIDSFTD